MHGGWADSLAEFVQLLRRNGVEVTSGEFADALRAAELLGPADREQLAAALGATLTKAPQDHAVFDDLFRLYFAGPGGDTAGQGDHADGEGTNDAAERGEAEHNAADRAIEQLGEGAPALAKSIAGGRRDRIAMALRTAARATELDHLDQFWQEGFLQYRMLQQMDADAARDALTDAAEAARDAGDEAAASWLTNRRRDFDTQARAFVRDLIRQRDLSARARFRRESLLDRSFRRASPAEIQRMRVEVERLARQLKTRVVLRKKAHRRGTLHVPATMRANLGTGAIPFKLKRRHRGRRRPELVIMVDMSESVRAASEFFLLFVHSLQDLFQRVRSFGFVADTVELTDRLRGRSFDAAFAELARNPGPQLVGHSDYGRAFGAFATKYGDAVTPRSTLIVLGDARSNYQPHHPELVRGLARRARHAMWLNPEPQGSWGLGDSVMPDYADAFELAAAVGNLRQLAHVVQRVVLPA